MSDKPQQALRDHPGYPYPSPAYAYEDEISLVDLGLLFYRRWRLFLLVFLTVTLLAALFAFTRLDSYAYRTTVEIGSHLLVGSEGTTETVLIESPSTVLAKVNESYIPDVLGEVAEDGRNVKVEARLPSDSNVIVLETNGVRANADYFEAVHVAIVERLLDDHASRFAVVIKNLQNEENRLLGQATSAENEAQALEAQFNRLDAVGKMLDEQMQDLQGLLEEAQSPGGTNEQEDVYAALAQIMLSNQILQYREELRRIEERRVVEIPRQRYELYRTLTDAQQRQETFQQEAAAVRLRLEELNQTRVLSTAVPSQSPTGVSGLVIVALGLFLGLFAAVFAVLLAEFTSKVRARQAAER